MQWSLCCSSAFWVSVSCVPLGGCPDEKSLSGNDFAPSVARQKSTDVFASLCPLSPAALRFWCRADPVGGLSRSKRPRRWRRRRAISSWLASTFWRRRLARAWAIAMLSRWPTKTTTRAASRSGPSWIPRNRRAKTAVAVRWGFRCYFVDIAAGIDDRCLDDVSQDVRAAASHSGGATE